MFYVASHERITTTAETTLIDRLIQFVGCLSLSLPSSHAPCSNTLLVSKSFSVSFSGQHNVGCPVPHTHTHTLEVFMQRVPKGNFLCGHSFSRRSSFQLSSARRMTWQTQGRRTKDASVESSSCFVQMSRCADYAKSCTYWRKTLKHGHTFKSWPQA